MLKGIKQSIFIGFSLIVLAGCNNNEETIKVKDCQSSVFGILNSGSYTTVMSDAITIKTTDSEGVKMKLSADICTQKNPMYFK